MGKKKVWNNSFVLLPRSMLKMKEYRLLSSSAKVVYTYLKYKFVGHNNGQIVLHYSELRDMMAKGTATSAFKELLQAGFITKEKIGGLFRFSNLYRLTGKYDNDKAIFKPNF